MHPAKDWRNFRQRYRLIGSCCSCCGTKFISPDQRCFDCVPLAVQHASSTVQPDKIFPVWIGPKSTLPNLYGNRWGWANRGVDHE